jgi:hypothetical protein
MSSTEEGVASMKRCRRRPLDLAETDPETFKSVRMKTTEEERTLETSTKIIEDDKILYLHSQERAVALIRDFDRKLAARREEKNGKMQVARRTAVLLYDKSRARQIDELVRRRKVPSVGASRSSSSSSSSSFSFFFGLTCSQSILGWAFWLGLFVLGLFLVDEDPKGAATNQIGHACNSIDCESFFGIRGLGALASIE